VNSKKIEGIKERK